MKQPGFSHGTGCRCSGCIGCDSTGHRNTNYPAHQTTCTTCATYVDIFFDIYHLIQRLKEDIQSGWSPYSVPHHVLRPVERHPYIPAPPRRVLFKRRQPGCISGAPWRHQRAF